VFVRATEPHRQQFTILSGTQHRLVLGLMYLAPVRYLVGQIGKSSSLTAPLIDAVLGMLGIICVGVIEIQSLSLTCLWA